MTIKPVTRKGTLGLLRLIREAKEGSEEAGQELLEYIGHLEQSEEALLRKIRDFTNNFDDESFVIYDRPI